MSDINVELNDYATANICLGKVASTGKFADKYPMRILVGEDNPFNKMFIDKLFEKFGYTDSHHAENGIEVLKKLENEEIDLILMDIQMPEMDGFLSKPFKQEALKEILIENSKKIREKQLV
jgi:PleD family two-component response regulator